MSQAGLVTTLTAALIGAAWTVTAKAADRETTADSPAEYARPAVLILRVWDSPDLSRRLRRIEVVDPRIIDELPAEEEARVGAGDRERAPRLGPDYELARTCVPNPRQPHLRYYIYHLNLSDPAVADNWRKLQRAQRKELRQAWAERYNDRNWARRKAQLLSAHERAACEGIAELQAGEYRQAIITLTRAAELNHGDPACRIYLALARVAVGHDGEAAKALRRALELQPKLVPMQLGLAQYYPSDEDFGAQVDALAQRLREKPQASADQHFLLGFMEFQRGRLDEANAAFRRAARRLPKDRLIRSYLKITKPVALSGPANG